MGPTNTVLASLPVPAGSGPNNVAVNPVDGNLVPVRPILEGFVTVIDGATDSVITNVALPGVIEGIALNPVTNKIYAPVINGTVVVIDGATNSTTTVTVGGIPINAAVNPVTNKIYVPNGSTSMIVLDGATNNIDAK